MYRRCCSHYHVGNKIMGEKFPLEDKSFTDGYCKPCAEKEIEKIERELEKYHQDQKAVSLPGSYKPNPSETVHDSSESPERACSRPGSGTPVSTLPTTEI